MATLTNTKIKDTYDGLLKTNDNGVLGSTSKEITDGLGNGSGIYIGTNEQLGIGTSSPFDSKLQVVGRIRAAGGTSGGYFFGSEEFDGGFYAPSDGNLAFSTNNTERMRIDSSGRVGIGLTSTNSVRLGITGNSGLPATSGSTQTGLLRLKASNNATLDMGADHTNAVGWLQVTDVADLSNEYNLLLQPNGGNLGIGTSSPSATLDVNGTIRLSTSGKLEGRDYPYNTNIGSDFNATTTNIKAGSTFKSEISLIGGDVGDRIEFKTNSAERMRIDSSGNVGIGTSSSVSPLTVAKSVSGGTVFNTEQVSIFNNQTGATGNEATIGFHLNNSSWGSATTFARVSAQLENGSTGATSLVFGTAADGSASTAPERMRITSGGTIQIGASAGYTTINQGAFFTKGGGDMYTANLLAGAGVSPMFKLQRNDVEKYNIGLGGNDNLAFINASGVATVSITSGGDVLIGTTSTPNGTANYGSSFSGESNSRMVLRLATSSTAQLSVARFFNPNGQVGEIKTDGSSTIYVTSSDYRLKEDWQPMANALDRIEALKPINFAWKVDGKRVDGFLAHELQEVVPEAVTGEKDATEEYEIPAVLDEEGNVIEEAVMGTRDVYQGIDQSKIVPLLVAAIQELKAEIELLKN